MAGSFANPYIAGAPGGYTNQTSGAELTKQGFEALNALGSKFSGNETIGNLVAGKYADAAGSMVNMGSYLTGNQAFLGQTNDFLSQQDERNYGYASKLMGQAGAIADAQLRRQGIEERAAYAAKGAEDRAGHVVQGAEDRKSRLTQGVVDVGNIQAKGAADLATIGETGLWNVRGIRAKGDEDRQLVRTQGEEDRAKLREEAIQQKGLRYDARGAIASAGARFYG